ncbi:hypothetical protein AVEN_212956-1 [Araneus ventricosus]|uniref:Uncharacterized protein n=1 Tax=Araneus ventricosus TaxID=182803 RepID=A0A4Y2IIY0_ARAVE|nr:hypothetical protein AVEN_212956-1 [Araneus ventricosus]
MFLSMLVMVMGTAHGGITSITCNYISGLVSELIEEPQYPKLFLAGGVVEDSACVPPCPPSTTDMKTRVAAAINSIDMNILQRLERIVLETQCIPSNIRRAC